MFKPQDQRDGEPLHVLRLAGEALLLAPILAPTVFRNPDVFPPASTFRRLQPSNLTPKGAAARGADLGGGEGGEMSDVETPISLEELRLAARNHAMPLEALRHPITPPGLHYLLIHYDIPDVDEAAFRLEVDGLVATPLSLSLAELRARPAVELAVTMECAGNGRALIEPHVV